MLSNPINRKKLTYGILLLFSICFVIIYCLYWYPTNNREWTYNNSYATPRFNHSKWIVVTTIANPTEDLKKLIEIPDWKVVVVGDKKTPSGWSLPGAVFLGAEEQKLLGYNIVAHLPFNSYTRKMIGYLYAIHNGARYIYDTDDDNHPSRGTIDFVLEPTMHGLVYEDVGRPVMNPLAHFGQSQMWPRGYPLELVSSKPNNSYRVGKFKTPAIQQGLVNGDPDVDAVYRLINRGSSNDKLINITFDARAPPVTLPVGVFAPFNSQNTLFSYDAFWALFLPTTVAFRVTDIWRGYWTQRLLWLIGQHLAFFPPNAVQFRNAHNYLQDFAEELQMYEEVGSLIAFLNDWKCRDKRNFFHCIKMLSTDMIEKNFIKEEDFKLIELWLADLKNIGYVAPKLKSSEILKETHWVLYAPPDPTTSSGYSDLLDFCANSLLNDSRLTSLVTKKDQHDLHKPTYVYDNILLVIVFNNPHMAAVRLLEALYRDHFPNMLFCSEIGNYASLMKNIASKNMSWRTNDISFINITSDNGYYGYECAIRAIEMNYRVDGYLLLGDDVLIKPWRLRNLDVSRSRIQGNTYDNRYENKKYWNWWNMPIGKDATNNALNEIASIAKNSKDDRSTIMKQFIHNRKTNNLDSVLVSCRADIYFISQTDAKLVLEVMKIFLQKKSFLELAVPTVVTALKPQNQTFNDLFVGRSIWNNDREHPFDFLKDKMVYIHPLKLGVVLSNSKLRAQYCANYIGQYLQNW